MISLLESPSLVKSLFHLNVIEERIPNFDRLPQPQSSYRSVRLSHDEEDVIVEGALRTDRRILLLFPHIPSRLRGQRDRKSNHIPISFLYRHSAQFYVI